MLKKSIFFLSILIISNLLYACEIPTKTIPTEADDIKLLNKEFNKLITLKKLEKTTIVQPWSLDGNPQEKLCVDGNLTTVNRHGLLAYANNKEKGCVTINFIDLNNTEKKFNPIYIPTAPCNIHLTDYKALFVSTQKQLPGGELDSKLYLYKLSDPKNYEQYDILPSSFNPSGSIGTNNPSDPTFGTDKLYFYDLSDDFDPIGYLYNSPGYTSWQRDDTMYYATMQKSEDKTWQSHQLISVNIKSNTYINKVINVPDNTNCVAALAAYRATTKRGDFALFGKNNGIIEAYNMDPKDNNSPIKIGNIDHNPIKQIDSSDTDKIAALVSNAVAIIDPKPLHD